MSPGVEACIQLNQFEEAIVFCDKGLAVSFKTFYLALPFFALCLNKVWKMGRKDILFWALHVCMHRRKRIQFESNREI